MTIVFFVLYEKSRENIDECAKKIKLLLLFAKKNMCPESFQHPENLPCSHFRHSLHNVSRSFHATWTKPVVKICLSNFEKFQDENFKKKHFFDFQAKNTIFWTLEGAKINFAAGVPVHAFLYMIGRQRIVYEYLQGKLI